MRSQYGPNLGHASPPKIPVARGMGGSYGTDTANAPTRQVGGTRGAYLKGGPLYNNGENLTSGEVTNEVRNFHLRQNGQLAQVYGPGHDPDLHSPAENKRAYLDQRHRRITGG